MQITDFKKIKKNIIGTSVPKPLSGTLSGHAAGEPFDKHVYKEIKKQFPKYTFRQYEYLNDLYSKNPETIGHEARFALFNSPTVMFLLSRGKNATNKWNIENTFEEKQNDTADILVVKDDFYEIIDIKTRNISKSTQPPNIISAYKLAQVCENAHYVNLFHSNPETLYINWAAAMQLQFHVCDLDQNFKGNIKSWTKTYLKHFVKQARKRTDYMIEKFVKPFEKYID